MIFGYESRSASRFDFGCGGCVNQLLKPTFHSHDLEETEAQGTAIDTLTDRAARVVRAGFGLRVASQIGRAPETCNRERSLLDSPRVWWLWFSILFSGPLLRMKEGSTTSIDTIISVKC